MKENTKWKSDNLEKAFNKHIELIEMQKKLNKQYMEKRKEISVLGHKDVVFNTTEDLYKYIISTKGPIIIMTGERGLYQFYIFIEANLNVSTDNLTFIVNPDFDRRTEGYISHPNGGIYKSYEYHIYTQNH